MTPRSKKVRPQERYVPPPLRFWRDFTLWIESETGLPAEERLGRTLYAGIEGRERPGRARLLFLKAPPMGVNHRMQDLWALCERVQKHLAIIVIRVIDDPNSRCRCPAEGSPDCSCDQDFNVELVRAAQMHRLAGPIIRACNKYPGPWAFYEENLYDAELDVVVTLRLTFPDLDPLVRRLDREALRRKNVSRATLRRPPDSPQTR